MVYQTNSKKLDDFGDDLHGAKKDLYQFRNVDLSNDETRKLPLSKLWDIKEIEAIEDKEIASIAHVLRENIPNKPRNSFNLDRWFRNLEESQAIVKALLDENNPVNSSNVIQHLQHSMPQVGDKVYLYSQIDREDWKLVSQVYTALSYNRENTQYTLSLIAGGKPHQFYADLEVNNSQLSGDIRKQIIDNVMNDVKNTLAEIKQKQLEQPLQQSKPKTQNIDFTIFYYRSTGEAFIICKSDRQRTPLVKGFDNTAEARAYLQENKDELVKLWQEHKEANTVRKSDMRNEINEERSGQSYRDGDITPEQFMETFGIRGGQFGNWVNTKERQDMLNSTYDGFMDLAKALNIEPKAIGLNGNLAIAFGARGSGQYSAHYEPLQTVINLTKTRGAGSLAHEWWHALDHYMGNHQNLLSKSPSPNTALHQELSQPVQELVKTIKQEELYKRSLLADGYRNKSYFSTNVEMTARAFEAYVIHELKNKGIKNDFLANIKSETDWAKNSDNYPYPRQNEIEIYVQSYRKIFDTLKEVDKEFVPVKYEPESIIHEDTIEQTIKTSKTKLEELVNHGHEVKSNEVNTTENDIFKVPNDVQDIPAQPTVEPVNAVNEPTPAPITPVSPVSVKIEPKQEPQNTYINVPYREKNQAKELGAKWDADKKSWYIPASENLEKFKRWLPENEKQNERHYIYTTPADSQSVKALGARYDVKNQAWYFIGEENREKFTQWLNRPNIPTPEELLAQHMKAQGIHVPAGHPVFDNKAHRLSNEGSKDKNVMYHGIPNPDGTPFATITNWSRGSEPEKWTYPIEYIIAQKNIDIVERLKGNVNYVRESNVIPSSPNTNYTQSKENTQQEKIESFNKMAELSKIVMSFSPVAEQHEYLSRKQVTPNNVVHIVPDKSMLPEQYRDVISIANDWREAMNMRNNNVENKLILQKGNLMIPQFNAQGELRAFETIGYQGSKYALKGAERKGLSLELGDVKNAQAIIIAEGYATGATLHEQANIPVIIAFGKNNFESVALSLREQYPDKRIYISADNDHKNELNGLENVGIKEATNVANKIQASVLIPQFNAGDTGKDWNDVYVDKGLTEFRNQLKSELSRNKREITEPAQTVQITPAPAEIKSKYDLSPERIERDYPNMSAENKAKIQGWNNYLSHYSEKSEDSRSRLESILSREKELDNLPTVEEYQIKKSASVDKVENSTNIKVNNDIDRR